MANCVVCKKPVTAGLVIDSNCYKELSRLQELKNKGLIKIFPCWIDDDLWFLEMYYESNGSRKIPKIKIVHGIIDHITIGSTGVITVTVCDNDTKTLKDFEACHFGEIVFRSL